MFWLLIGVMMMIIFVLLCVVVGLVCGCCWLGYLLVLVVMWIVGFINVLYYVCDVWVIMLIVLLLLVVVIVLVLVVVWIGFVSLCVGGV